jgi:hypothetical protein
MIANKLHESLNEFFNKLRDDGMTAIALSENEEARMKMLGLLQYATRKEIELKQMIADLEDGVIITDGSGISIEQLANTNGPITEVKIEQHG